MRRQVMCQATIMMATLGLLLAGRPVRASESLFEAMGMAKLPHKIAPDFTLPSIGGKPVALHQYRGKVVFLNFWATWCIPCREEMPAIEQLHHTYKDLAILTINLKESAEQVKAFFQKHTLSFPALLDADGSTFRDYLVMGMPTTYLIDRDGTMLARGVGGKDWTKAEGQALIRTLVEKAPATSTPRNGEDQSGGS